MHNKTCHQCGNFIRHYSLRGGKLYSIFCGHCILFPSRRKHLDTSACEHFVQGEEDTDLFVKKEYLTKALLERVLSMEILPEIEEAPPELQCQLRRG